MCKKSKSCSKLQVEETNIIQRKTMFTLTYVQFVKEKGPKLNASIKFILVHKKKRWQYEIKTMWHCWYYSFWNSDSSFSTLIVRLYMIYIVTRTKKKNENWWIMTVINIKICMGRRRSLGAFGSQLLNDIHCIEKVPLSARYLPFC